MYEHEPFRSMASSSEPGAARYGACSIQRDAGGGYRVSHGACPERSWLLANLPTAHALCAELDLGLYGCQIDRPADS